MDEKDREFLLVGYFPQTDRRLPPGTKLLLDPVMSAAFEVSIETAAIIDPEIFSRHLNAAGTKESGTWPSEQSRVKAQIMVQSGVTDINTANVLAGFYMDIEQRRWGNISNVLIDALEYWVPAIFIDAPKANEKDLFTQALKQWSYKYKETMIDIEWANISTDHAMVKFSVLCHGSKVVDALSEYKFDLIGDEVKIKSIYNHGMETLPLQMFNEKFSKRKAVSCIKCRLHNNCYAEKLGTMAPTSAS